MVLGNVGKRRGQSDQSTRPGLGRASQVEPQVQVDLVVSRSAGVKLPGDLTDKLAETSFDRAVHVFVVVIEHECARPGLISDGPKTGKQLVDVTSVKELVKRWYPKGPKMPKKSDAHMALIDIRESIDEMLFYREHYFVDGASQLANPPTSSAGNQ